ncbi:Aste57867_11796 [Aphanomyces stellatus]|uniref:Aste57867_11796 protein n=1 Tax=Aphanomyces stellatus TaxID=120398 RepID=A0A485KTX7_9STRA|nr:hypothetical protein As57867_011751 [Aphanomyces stellatus]VFT88651.1 Aste57867_11796 [Aphanomyces stellatus]
MLQYIQLSGCDNVVVYPRALANYTNQSLEARVNGSGSIYIQEAAIKLNRLTLGVSGSGDIQFNVPETKLASGLALTISGSGGIVFAATSLLANRIDSSVSGSGMMNVEVSNAINISSSVSTSISGSGLINYSGASSSCDHHVIKVSGSGSIHAGALTCTDTKVSLFGSGDIFTSSKQSLDVSMSGSGFVFVVGLPPPTLSESVTTVATDPVPRYLLIALPNHTASHMFQFGTGLLCVLAVVMVIVVAFLVRRFGRCCCRRHKDRSDMTAGPYGESATPIAY